MDLLAATKVAIATKVAKAWTRVLRVGTVG